VLYRVIGRSVYASSLDSHQAESSSRDASTPQGNDQHQSVSDDKSTLWRLLSADITNRCSTPVSILLSYTSPNILNTGPHTLQDLQFLPLLVPVLISHPMNGRRLSWPDDCECIACPRLLHDSEQVGSDQPEMNPCLSVVSSLANGVSQCLFHLAITLHLFTVNLYSDHFTTRNTMWIMSVWCRSSWWVRLIWQLTAATTRQLSSETISGASPGLASDDITFSARMFYLASYHLLPVI
jgi:hypothetical protein